MDYDFSVEQQSLLGDIDATVDAVGGIERAREISNTGGYDTDLDVALGQRLDLDGAGLLERVLVAERLAQLGTATSFGLRTVLSHRLPLGPGAVAVVRRDSRRAVRFGSVAASLVLVDDRAVDIATLAAPLAAVPSSFGFPYGRADSEVRGAAVALAAPELIGLWHLALAAEIAGNAASAVERTASHLTERRQFGQPLAKFQALRHRIADAAVTAEGIRWLVRRAAFAGDAYDIALAASYAAEGAASLVPELVQMCGARSFTIAFGLHTYTMRLSGLRLELGAADRLSHRVRQATPDPVRSDVLVDQR